MENQCSNHMKWFEAGNEAGSRQANYYTTNIVTTVRNMFGVEQESIRYHRIEYRIRSGSATKHSQASRELLEQESIKYHSIEYRIRSGSCN